MALTTRANFKTWANIGVTTFDGVIDAVLPQAERMVAQVLNRAVSGASRLEDPGSDITEYYDGTGTKTLWLNAYPITSVTSVSYLSSVASGAASYTAFDTSSYYHDPASGRLIRSGLIDRGFTDDESVWPEGLANIKVVYQAGYTSGTVPVDLQECIYEVISAMMHGRDATREDRLTNGDIRTLILDRVGHYARQGA